MISLMIEKNNSVNMIIVKISGGLGNQLFQYTFGQYVAKKTNKDVVYDIQTDLRIANFTPRTLALLNFNLELNVATEKDIRKMRFFSKKSFQRIERKLVQLYPFLNKKYKVEKNFHSEFIQDVKDNCYYDGYWQSFKYLDLNESLLRSQMVLDAYSLKNKAELIDRISNSQSVSIHIRRGDYISIKANSSIFNLCSLEYYSNAINYINSSFPNAQYYIFSDDIEWTKLHFIGDQYLFMDGNEPIEDLYMMSLCKHNIIANSTFSWWSAWLNQDRNKIVIAPKQWYVGKQNDFIQELIPNKWIQM